MKKRITPEPIARETLQASLTFSKAGQPVEGEPQAGYYGVRPAGELPGTVEEVSRSLRAHYPKCFFAWLPPRTKPA
jgi:hypothetical protein